MSPARIRVMFAIPSLDRDGPDRVMFELLTALDRTRFEPSLLVSEPEGHYLSKLPTDVPVTVLGTQRSFASRYPVVKSLQAIRRARPDIVFSTLRMNLTLGVASFAFPKATRLVLRQANDFSTDFRLMTSKAPVKQRVAQTLVLATLRRADAIVCQSEAMLADLRRALGRNAPLRAISNPVDIDAVARSAAEHVSLRGTPALISVGRLMPQKGFDILVPAIARLRSRWPNLHVTVLGDGPDRAQLVERIRELELDEHVTLAGFSSQVLPTVRAADLFVLASRYEGFPNAALEALACGTPVVLTDCPGANSEIVRPINGTLASSVTVESMAEAIATALERLGSFDRAQIIADTRARYGAQRITAAYEQVFSSVI